MGVKREIMSGNAYEIKSVGVEQDHTIMVWDELGYNPPPHPPRPFHKRSKVYTNPRIDALGIALGE